MVNTRIARIFDEVAAQGLGDPTLERRDDALTDHNSTRMRSLDHAAARNTIDRGVRGHSQATRPPTTTTLPATSGVEVC